VEEKQPEMRELFVRVRDFRTDQERRDYVLQEMLQLIQGNDLYLTEIMNQDITSVQYAGDVIYGHGISDGSTGIEAQRHMTGLYIPEEIKNHRVLIESCSGNTVKYIDGTRPIKGIVVGNRTKHKVARVEENVIDTGKTKAWLPLKDAWSCLKRWGKWVTFGETPDDRKNNWLFQEVRGAIEGEEKPLEKKRAAG
jgi:hypothetical protein